MKKSTTQILIVIIISVITVSCKDKKEVSQAEETAVEKKIVRNIEPGYGMSIAFVNSDTVSKYYEFAKKIQKTLTSKRLEAENQIKNKYFAYERLVKEFEKASPIMGDREKMEKAQKIRFLEQEIMQVEQQLSEQVSKEELQLTQSYILKTNEFMQEIGASLGYDYVMSFRVGGAMLYANDKNNITSDIIKLLNQRYETSK